MKVEVIYMANEHGTKTKVYHNVSKIICDNQVGGARETTQLIFANSVATVKISNRNVIFIEVISDCDSSAPWEKKG